MIPLDPTTCANRKFGITLAWLLAAVGLVALVPMLLPRAAAAWQAGVAKVAITPEKPMWMSGYASRTHPAEGTLHDLWAKALVLQDDAGHRAVLITLDLVGIKPPLSVTIADALTKKYSLDRSQIALATSHTHCGPVVGSNLRSMYFFDEAQQQLVDEYAVRLQGKVVAVVGQALADLRPAEVQFGSGTATFAVNRRNNPEADVPGLRADGKLRGPVDHAVPVLTVRQPGGSLRAIVCGYACHATTLSFYQWSGDWPGFTQIELEQAHPGAIALFWAGCGADQNPIPRRTVELAADYGKQLATAVQQVIQSPQALTTVAGKLGTVYQEIPLPFDMLPDRDKLREEAKSSNKYLAKRAEVLLAELDRDGALPTTYPYPVQTWAVGDRLDFVILGGEVVVDYAIRLKAELRTRSLFVAGYANDVMAYIPSRRVLLEGGYEGASSMIYYGHPTVWAPSIEEQIVAEVHRQIARLRAE